MKTEKEIVDDLVKAIEAIHKNVSLTQTTGNSIQFKEGSNSLKIKPFQKGTKKVVVLR
jgi:hypothetical protein